MPRAYLALNALVEAGEAAPCLRIRIGPKPPSRSRGSLNPNRAAIGDDRLAAGAVAFVDLTGRFGLARWVAQRQIHLAPIARSKRR
ncbi:hypothetical protein DP49_1706 [Burkholderia pseudomallei]|nr:hypothetical protein DO70_1696 [Burkholderia pseudomallei]KGD53306.1 hypothetical protein DP49_1706 [Burkholderia pseudomallei]